MYVYQDHSAGFKEPRMHPFVGTELGHAGFIDFRKQPDRIPTVLEDFIPFAHTPAIQTFYRLLTWINGPESVLESCDCALRAPEPHASKHSKLLLRVHGRLMLMHRDLSANCDGRFSSLYNIVGQELSSIDSEFPSDHGSVCFAGSRAIFRELLPDAADVGSRIVSRFGDPGRGYQLMLQFQAFGNWSEEAFESLDRVFPNIDLACRRASDRLVEIARGTP